jgi:hypothetical protein
MRAEQHGCRLQVLKRQVGTRGPGPSSCSALPTIPIRNPFDVIARHTAHGFDPLPNLDLLVGSQRSAGYRHLARQRPLEAGARVTAFDDGSHLRLSVRYGEQPQPRALAGAFPVIGRDFMGEDPSALILGDEAVAPQPAALRPSVES